MCSVFLKILFRIFLGLHISKNSRVLLISYAVNPSRSVASFQPIIGGLTFPTLLPLWVPVTVMCDMQKKHPYRIGNAIPLPSEKNIANSYRYRNG